MKQVGRRAATVGLCLVGVAAMVPLIGIGYLLEAVENLRSRCQESPSMRDLLTMNALYPLDTPTRAAGYCGTCREPVRHGEACCEMLVGWIAPDGLAWLDYEDYVVSVAAGIIDICRRSGEKVPDDILALDSDLFLAVTSEADITRLLRVAYDEDWSAAKIKRHWERIDRRP